MRPGKTRSDKNLGGSPNSRDTTHIYFISNSAKPSINQLQLSG